MAKATMQASEPAPTGRELQERLITALLEDKEPDYQTGAAWAFMMAQAQVEAVLGVVEPLGDDGNGTLQILQNLRDAYRAMATAAAASLAD